MPPSSNPDPSPPVSPAPARNIGEDWVPLRTGDHRAPLAPVVKRRSPFVILGSFALAIGLLYWGKPVLMPLALAVLFTFLLHPVVSYLDRRGLGRAPAVLLVVILVFSLLGAVIWVFAQQISSLAEDLPEYKDNIRTKISDFQTAGRGSAVEKIQTTVLELLGELEAANATNSAAASNRIDPVKPAPPVEEPVRVVVEGEKPPQKLLPTALGPVLEFLAMVGLVIVLVIFMLLRLQELRNRILRLVGFSRLTATTKAIDEAGERISRYLLMQTTINASYGLAVGVGLYFIGLPYVLLWGFLAFLARFIPYVGPWIGALLPITFSLAVFDGWMHPFFVIGLIVVLELISNMIMEPWLYGQTAGVSEVALIVALAFWTWIWGPVGLALATPLTVCVVVLCKYIPELEFVEVLMGDAPVMDRCLVFYQRLLAADQDEAMDVVQEYLRAEPSDSIFENLFLPVLASFKRDAARGNLSAENQAFIFQAIRELAEEVDLTEPGPPPDRSQLDASARVRVLGVPAHDAADEIALVMLRRLLDPKRVEVEILSSEILSSEVISIVAEKNPAILCIGALPPNAVAPIRYLCKRLRERFSGLKIVVGRWGTDNPRESRDKISSVGADFIATTFLETRTQIYQLTQLINAAPPGPSGGKTPSLAEPMHSETARQPMPLAGSV